MIHKAYSLISPSFDPLKEEYIALSSIVSFFFFFNPSYKKKGSSEVNGCVRMQSPSTAETSVEIHWNSTLEYSP